MTKQKRYLLDRAGKLHIWTESSCDTIHKACERQKLTNFSMKIRHEILPLHRRYWQFLAARRVKVIFPKSSASDGLSPSMLAVYCCHPC